MQFIFLIKNDSTIYWQKGKLCNNILVMDKKCNIKKDSDFFKNNNTVSLFNYNESLKNYNLLELTKCNTISSLRHKLYKKRYISSKISNQLVILSDCFIKLINESKIEISESQKTNDFLADCNDNELVTEPVILDKEAKLTQTDKNNNYDIISYFIFYGLGVISGYILCEPNILYKFFSI